MDGKVAEHAAVRREKSPPDRAVLRESCGRREARMAGAGGAGATARGLPTRRRGTWDRSPRPRTTRSPEEDPMDGARPLPPDAPGTTRRTFLHAGTTALL